jgi:hypothetical protein
MVRQPEPCGCGCVFIFPSGVSLDFESVVVFVGGCTRLADGISLQFTKGSFVCSYRRRPMHARPYRMRVGEVEDAETSCCGAASHLPVRRIHPSLVRLCPQPIVHTAEEVLRLLSCLLPTSYRSKNVGASSKSTACHRGGTTCHVAPLTRRVQVNHLESGRNE